MRQLTVTTRSANRSGELQPHSGHSLNPRRLDIGTNVGARPLTKSANGQRTRGGRILAGSRGQNVGVCFGFALEMLPSRTE